MLLGRSAMCYTKCEQCEHMAKHMLKDFQEESDVLSTSPNVIMWSFLKIIFLASLVAILSYLSISLWTSRGSGSILALSSLPFLCQFPSSFFLTLIFVDIATLRPIVPLQC